MSSLSRPMPVRRKKAMKLDDDIHQEVRRWPGVAVMFAMGGKHRRAIFTFNGKDRFVTFPTTPSDSRRGPQNMLATVRRTLKALGAQRAQIASNYAVDCSIGAIRRAVVEAVPTIPAPSDPAPAGDCDCECLSCLSDMKGIYPCLLEDEGHWRAGRQ